jgi:Putative Flp pilus-assembly TadE/G-like
MQAIARNYQGLRRAHAFVRDTAGNIAMMTALSLPAIMGTIGIASDYANFSAKSQALQLAADQAAIAGAKQLAITSSTDTAIQAAAQAFVATTLTGDISTTVNINRGTAAVSVSVTERWTPFFAHFLGARITPIIADAQASLTGQANICILALDTASSASLQLVTGAKLTTHGCGVYANSTSPSSVKLKNASVIAATETCTAGGIDASGGTISPAGLTDCPITEDPLAGRAVPAAGGCTFNNVSINNTTTTLTPGTYCGGIKISGHANVAFSPGDYIIRDDKFSISGTASVQGSNVAFFLKGDEAELNFVGNSTINFSGAETGPMAGLLFFGDPAADDTIKPRINSAHTDTLTGTIYLPHGELTIDPTGGTVAENSAYTAIVTKTLKLAGGPEVVLNSDYGATHVPVPAGIQATAEVVLSQ